MSRPGSARSAMATAGVSAVADKRFLRPDVRSAARDRSGGWRRRLMRAALLLAVGAAVLAGAVLCMTRARALAVDTVIVSGNHRLSNGEVHALIGGLRGQSILRVDLNHYRARLLDSPWVADARLRRRLPGTIEISIVERVPMAAARIGRQLYLIDADGVIIDEYGAQDAEFDLPVVDGLASTSNGGGPIIDVPRAHLAAGLLDALAARPDLRARVSQVDVSDVHDAIVVLDGDTALLHLGDTQWVERLQQYLELLPTLRDKFNDIDYVDLRFGANVYVRPRRAAATGK